MKFKTIFAGLVLLAGLAGSGGSAQASLMSISDLIPGNDSLIAVSDFLGVNLTLIDKFEDPTNDVDGTMPMLLDGTLGLGTTSGTWSTNPATPIDVIVLKAGTNYIILNYIGMAVTGGNWCTDGLCTVDGIPLLEMLNNGGQIAGLSHISAYSVVPIPAALPLFLSALAGFVLIARRRKQLA